MGYRGAEPSIMRDLFLDNDERADHYKLGVYWCVRTDRGMPEVGTQPPLVQELVRRLGKNFCLSPITDFDTALAELRQLFDERSVRASELGTVRIVAPTRSSPSFASDERALPFDLRPSDAMAISSVDWTVMRDRLIIYARRLEQMAPDDPDEQWFAQQALRAVLPSTLHNRICLTNGGILLLSQNGRQIAHGAWVEVRLPGRPPMAIDGSLWEQYEAVLDALEEANRPVRMKGARSETAPPYPGAALKEVIANALVHRDYETGQPILVSVSPDSIRVESPGGLEHGLLRRLLGGAFPAEDSPHIPQHVLQ